MLDHVVDVSIELCRGGVDIDRAEGRLLLLRLVGGDVVDFLDLVFLVAVGESRRQHDQEEDAEENHVHDDAADQGRHHEQHEAPEVAWFFLQHDDGCLCSFWLGIVG